MEVVIVDDERSDREDLLKKADWQSLGLRVALCASSAQEALRYIGGNPADIVITDIRMPQMDGLELMRRLADRPMPPSVILVSRHSDFAYAQCAIRHEAVDYLLKPVSPKALRDALARAVQRRRRETLGRASTEQQARYQMEANARANTLCTQMADAICAADAERAAACCEALYALFFDQGYPCELFKKYTFRCIYQCVHSAEDFLGCGIAYFDNMQPLEELASAQSYPEVLAQLRLCTEDLCATVDRAGSGKKRRIVNHVITFICYGYADETLSVASLAGQCGITPNYLSSLFKKQMGISLTDYLENYRMDKAKEYLADVRLKIYEAAARCGYADAKHFTKVFKKHFGKTPQEWRNMVVE